MSKLQAAQDKFIKTCSADRVNGVSVVSVGARSAVFAPLDQLGRVEAVVQRLSDAITLGVLGNEEQLPSENELANSFGVSTVSVREALVALRQQGLVKTRRGRGGGSFVRSPAVPTAKPLRDRLQSMTLAELRDVGDYYTAIAGTAAKFAAERASDEDVRRIEEAAKERDATIGIVHRAERSFHMEIAAAAQSPRLTQHEVQLQGELGSLLWFPASEAGQSARVTEEHSAIVAAIAAADGVQARSLTETHITEAVHRLAEMHLQLVSP
jgi:DNA-binding FadR family transcriptional regulator